MKNITLAILLLTVLLLSLTPTVTAQGVELCPPVFSAGGHTIYRCVDEAEGNIIYINELGFMFALEW